MWHHRGVSVVLVTKNNGDTIRNVIEDIFYTGFADEVLIIDLSSKDRTLSEVSYTKARMATAKSYRDAFQQAFDRCSGELVIFSDPSGQIPGNQVSNLLPFSRDCAAVFSSRVVWLGNYKSKLMQRNISLGKKMTTKLETVLFNDVNSNLFLLDKAVVRPEKFSFQFGQKDFVFEVMLNCFSQGISHIQVPCEFHASLTETDGHLLSFWKYTKLSQAISKLEKSFSRRSFVSTQKSRVLGGNASSETSEQLDPILVKRRIAALRRKLGAVDDPVVPAEMKAELDNAIKEVTNSKKKSKKTKSKLSIEEEYEVLGKLEAGLSKRRKKKKNTDSDSD